MHISIDGYFENYDPSLMMLDKLAEGIAKNVDIPWEDCTAGICTVEVMINGELVRRRIYLGRIKEGANRILNDDETK